MTSRTCIAFSVIVVAFTAKALGGGKISLILIFFRNIRIIINFFLYINGFFILYIFFSNQIQYRRI